MAQTFKSHPNLELSTVEQTGPRGYIRPLFFFALSKDVSASNIMGLLQKGLQKTKKAVPMLSAELIPDTQSEQKGRFLLRQGDFGELHEKDVRGQFPLTYDELRKLNFPASALPQDVFCPVPIFPAPGKTIPVFSSQATLIEGGLVLNICIMHLCGDARAIYDILKIWAQNCRHILDPVNNTGCESVARDVFTKEPFVHGSPSEKGGKAEDHPEYALFNEPPAPPPAMLKTTFRTEVYYISKEKLRQLKADASARLPEGAWISTHDAVCALIWRCALAAQVDMKTVGEHTKSLNTICVDGRLRSKPNLSEDHIGMPMVYATPSIDLRESLASDDFSHIALAIRRAVASTDANYINSLVNWFNTIPSYDCLGPVSFGGLMNTSVMMTSWFKIPFYSINWGSVFSSNCESTRTVFEGFFNGSQVVLPELPEERGGGMEVVVGLDEENWNKFRQDQLWFKYAESR